MIRMFFSAAVGSLFSLYIFFPYSNYILEILIKILCSFLMTITAFGIINIKKFLKANIVLLSITCLYFGLVIAVWNLFKPQNIIISNSVVYYNISPLILILFTVIFYFLFKLLFTIFSLTSKYSERCSLSIYSDNDIFEAKGIIDSGNSITDPFGSSDIIIVDTVLYNQITDNKYIKDKYRVIPCKTVGGNSLLDGIRCDKCIIKTENKICEINKPIIAKSKTEINDDYTAIINPKSLE